MDKRKEAQRLYRKGRSYAAIACRLGVSKATARRYALGLYGADRSPKGRPRSLMSDAAATRRATAIRHKRKGWPVSAIAAALNVSRTTVYKYLRTEELQDG